MSTARVRRSVLVGYFSTDPGESSNKPRPRDQKKENPVGQRSVGNSREIYVGIVTIRFVGPALLRNTALSHSLTTVMEARLASGFLSYDPDKTRSFLTIGWTDMSEFM